MWPQTLDDFETYWETTLEETVPTEQSRQAAAAFLYGLTLPWFLFWMPFLLRVFMTNWLPEKARRAYGLPDPSTWWVRLTYNVVVCLVSSVYALVPRSAKMWAHELMLSDMRQSADDIRRTGRWLV